LLLGLSPQKNAQKSVIIPLRERRRDPREGKGDYLKATKGRSGGGELHRYR